MKNLLILFTFLFATSIAFAAEKTTEVFTLDHQMSTHCEKKIKENLRFEKGVSYIEVSLKENTISITFNPAKTDTDKLIKAFKKIGFNACLVNSDSTANSQEEKPCCGHHKE